MKLLINATLALTIWLFVGSASAQRPDQKLETLKPYSLTLEQDMKSCHKSGCHPIIGITTETLILNDLSKPLPITLDFENCQMRFSAWKFRDKGDYILITDGDNTPVEVNCDGRIATYPKASFLRRNGEHGIKLRKIDNIYSHLGRLSIGVMFMPIKQT